MLDMVSGHYKDEIGSTFGGTSCGSALEYKINNNPVIWLQIHNVISQSQPLLKSKLLEKSKNTWPLLIDPLRNLLLPMLDLNRLSEQL